MYRFLSEARNRVLEEIDPRIGYLKLNLANEDHYDFFVEKVGGLEKFEAENPELLSVVQNLKNSNVESTPFFTADGIHEGPDDLMAIENLMVRNNTKALGTLEKDTTLNEQGVAQIKADYIKKKKRIKVLTEFYDADKGILLNTKDDFVDDTNEYNSEITADYSQLVQDKARKFLIVSTFFCTETNTRVGSEELMLNAYVVKQDSFVVKGSNQMIKSLTLNDPVKKAGHTGDEVRVSYLRDGVIPDYDYSYPFDPFLDAQHQKIKVRMPFSVTVEAADSFWIDGIAEEYGYDLWLTNLITGQVRSYANMSQIIQRKDAFNKNNQCTKMTFIFPEFWNNILDFSKLGYTPYTEIDFYGSFKVLVSDEYSSLPIGISVKSYDQIYDALNIQCKKIWIQWGCVAKDTKITMADGSYKEAQYITLEDSIMTYNGKPFKIANIYSGPQDKIQEIVTESGKRIKITKDHTVFSENGLIPAADLVVGMKIRTKDGVEVVIQNDEVEYNDTVYNFKFESGTVLIGNDIFIGDYLLQNTIKELTEYED